MHPYRHLFDSVERPCRYVGGEYLEVRKEDERLFRVALCFPEVYDIGMSHLGLRILYSLLNRDPRIACERCFAPWKDMEKALRESGLPLVSLETARPLAAFDVVGFSLQYELTYTNILLMLDLGGIPRRAEARRPGDPFVIAGGPTATHPEPLASFIDAFFIGEAEELLPELVCELAKARRAASPRSEVLAELATRFPLYVPALYERSLTKEGLLVVDGPKDSRLPARVRRAIVADLDRYPFPEDAPVPHVEAVFDRAGVEIARGCTEGCRFCQAGMISRPVRFRHPREIVKSVLGGVRRGGYDETSLTSLSTADYPALVPLALHLLEMLEQEHVSLGLSSLRAYGLSETLLRKMAAGRMTGLTFAPEAGTQRLRDVIAKNVTEEDLEETARRVFGLGCRKIKLYYMLGLPTETDEDVAAIAKLSGRIERLGKRLTRQAHVTVSVSTHVPKPHTPFQWCAMDPLPVILRKQRLLRDIATKERLSLKWHEASMSVIEAALGRGDIRLGDVIEHAYLHGARFDAWDEHFLLAVWSQAFEACGLELERYLREIPVGARLPWDHIDVGIDPAFLEREHRLALLGKTSPPCGKAVGQRVHHATLEEEIADTRKLVCYACGAGCDLDNMRRERREFLSALRPETPEAKGKGEPGNTAPEAILSETTVPRVENTVPRNAPSETPLKPGPRVRVLVTKLGPAVYLGHLDFMRLIPRIARRTGVALAYSSGFHPKPDLVAGPALSLGIPSLGECFDIRLRGMPKEDVALLCERLTRGSPEGVRFVRAALLRDNDPPLGRVVNAADYAVEVGTFAATAEEAAAKFMELCRADAVVVRHHGEDTRALSVKRLLVAATPAPPSLDLEALGLVGPVCVVRLRLTQEAALKPQELLEAARQHASLEPQAPTTSLMAATGVPQAPAASRTLAPSAPQAPTTSLMAVPGVPQAPAASLTPAPSAPHGTRPARVARLGLLHLGPNDEAVDPLDLERLRALGRDRSRTDPASL